MASPNARTKEETLAKGPDTFGVSAGHGPCKYWPDYIDDTGVSLPPGSQSTPAAVVARDELQSRSFGRQEQEMPEDYGGVCAWSSK